MESADLWNEILEVNPLWYQSVTTIYPDPKWCPKCCTTTDVVWCFKCVKSIEQFQENYAHYAKWGQQNKTILGFIDVEFDDDDLVMLDGTNKVIYYRDAKRIMEAEDEATEKNYLIREDEFNQKLSRSDKEYQQQKQFIGYDPNYPYRNYPEYFMSTYKDMVREKFGQSLHPKVVKDIETIQRDYPQKKEQKKLVTHNRTEQLLIEQNRLIREQTEEIRNQGIANAIRPKYY